jgi:hypothetical protein
LRENGWPVRTRNLVAGLNPQNDNRTPPIGQIVLFEHHASRYAAAKITAIEDDIRGASRDWLEFEFGIIEDGGDDFSFKNNISC